MIQRLHIPPATLGLVLLGCFFLTACGTTVTVVVAPTVTTIAATATPAPGVCAADFSAPGNAPPDAGFQYPPLTRSTTGDGAAGNHYYGFCSSGTPTTILAFLKTSIPAGGWTITASTITTLEAYQTSKPQDGFCASVDITVGSHPGYPGQWDADFHPPAAMCP